MDTEIVKLIKEGRQRLDQEYLILKSLINRGPRNKFSADTIVRIKLCQITIDRELALLRRNRILQERIKIEMN